jgi:hypothetical protein
VGSGSREEEFQGVAMNEDQVNDYIQDAMDQQEKERKRARNTVFILGWTVLVLAAWLWGHTMSVLGDPPISLILSGAGGFLIGHYGGRAIRSYAKSRGLLSRW